MEIAGFDAATIVSQLMQIERQPLLALQTRKDAAKVAADALGKIRSEVDAFRLAASKLSTSSSWQRHTATTSGSSASVAVTGTAYPGSFSFSVGRLATSHGLRSTNTVASASVAITAESVLAVATGTRSVGIESVRAGSGLGVGDVELSVTQASAAAVTAGTSALAASTEISSALGNNMLAIDVNGAGVTHLTLADGTYGAQGLADQIQTHLDAAGLAVRATVGPEGALQLSTARHGSGASIRVTGGTALGDLGLSVDVVPNVGVDGIVDVGGVITTLSTIESGGVAHVDTGDGMLDIVFSGGLDVGTADVAVVSTGDRSLAAVAAAINGSGAGVSAAAVKVADGAWRLQLNGRLTGADGNIGIDTSAFSALGAFQTTSEAQNAQLVIGSGVGAYTIEASGNTFADVMPGVTITAMSESTSPVTVTVARNDMALTNDVTALVSAANTILADIKVQTRFDTTNKTSGPLSGDGTVRRLADQVRSVLSDVVGGTADGVPSQFGIEVQKDGTFAFDSAKFQAALNDDADRVVQMFARGGVGTGSVSFAAADDLTASGSYAVVVSTAATRADSGVLLVGGALADTRLGVRIGDVTVNVDVTIGQSEQQIVDSLNAALASAGLDVTAEAEAGGGLRVRANQWGSGGDFELNTDVLGVGTWNAYAGDDVVGTIDGVSAIGVGLRLSLPASADTSAAGLAVDVAAGASGAVGSLDYVPGIAARVVRFATLSIDEDDGALESAKDAAQRRIDGFADQIERFEARLAIREDRLSREFSALQTLLSQLQSQGSWLSSQVSTMNYSWGPSSG